VSIEQAAPELARDAMVLGNSSTFENRRTPQPLPQNSAAMVAMSM
jgi:hypothetical protein